MGTLTAVLEALQSPQPPALPAPLAQLVHDYWQARPLQQALVGVDAEVARSAPELGRLLAEFRRESSFEMVWTEHQGILTAAFLTAVWSAAVCTPRLKSEAPLAEWIEVLLPVSRYLEPAFYGERRRSGPEALKRLQDLQWVKGWVGDPELAQQIARHTATEAQTIGRRWYQDRRFNGVEHLLTGIQIVLGQGPLPPGSITRLLPGIEPAPGVESLHTPGTVTLPSRPGARPLAAPLLPLDYIARAELAELVGQLTSGVPETARAIVLSGITGAGKTTLAAGLAREPAVAAAFPDGILWVPADQGDMLADLCRQAGLVGRDSEPWPVRWRQWAGEPTRRALVILDDVADATLLAPIAGGLGDEMALVVTTQFGDAVSAELARWLPVATVVQRQIAGATPADARLLFEAVLDRPLEAQDTDKLAEAGSLLGWHTGALWFAANQVREHGWEAVLAELRAGGLPSDMLGKLVQRQWERLSFERQRDLAALVRYATGHGPFGIPYALAAWNVKETASARLRLTHLARAGLLESLHAHPHNLYLSAELWRVAPVVERIVRQAGNVSFPERVRRWFTRWRMADKLKQGAGPLFHVPLQFQLLGTLWWLVWGPPKIAIEFLLWLAGRVLPAARSSRWTLLTLPGAVEEHLRARWQRLGLEPSQELWLIYGARTTQGSVVAIALAAIALGLFIAYGATVVPWLLRGWGQVGGWLLGFACVAWILHPAVWRTWLAHLYGVQTGDLRMIVRACRILGMKDGAAVSEAPETNAE